MGNTVSNEKRTIATKGSTHFARTKGAKDSCHLPQAPAPFDNFIPTTKLAKGQTVKTMIQGQPIWTAAGEVGPKSMLPHPTHATGVASGKPHQGEATPTSWSGDVIVEGNGVVRHNDTTMQNSGNIDGIVDEAGLPPGSPMAIRFLKAKCSLSKLEGVDDKGRELGWPGKKTADPAYYLEILAKQTVTLTSERVDITEEPRVIDPSCGQVPDHTTWLITRSGGGAPNAEKRGSGKVYTVDSGMTSLRALTEADPMGALGFSGLGKGKSSKSAGALADTEGAISSIAGLYEFWKYWRQPCVIKAQAQACAGPKNVELRMFPKNKVDFTLSLPGPGTGGISKTSKGGQALRRAIYSSIKTARKITDVIAKICRLGGYKFKFQFLEGLQLTFEMEYKHCSKTVVGEANGKLYTPAHVGLKWKFAFASSPLIEFGVEIPISIINFILPGVGETAAYWLRKCRIKADVIFTASLGVSVEVSVGRDEHNAITEQGGEVGINPSIGAKLALGAGINLVTLGARFDGSFKAALRVGAEKNVLMSCKFSGEIQPVVSLTLLEDSWFERSWTKKPDAWKITLFETKAYPLLKMP